ncbi:hypothetical protein B0I35DRAFT_230091 [Stachybotrys elegans]|uniref:Uncharacterized protein n=1 Tax=Stachybotrys elegans TaxID=80388 RepID=A0A8K0SQY3_9HYPO|nr:hypothetical protein B0I35DRAFT_230091 [Stachybotrys elegans]
MVWRPQSCFTSAFFLHPLFSMAWALLHYCFFFLLLSLSLMCHDDGYIAIHPVGGLVGTGRRRRWGSVFFLLLPVQSVSSPLPLPLHVCHTLV